LEINHHPSLNLDEPIDRLVKGNLLVETLTLVQPMYKDKTSTDTSGASTPLAAEPLSPGSQRPLRVGVEEVHAMRARRHNKHQRALKWEDGHCTGLSRVYPNDSVDDYEEMAPYLREDFLAAYETAARVGERSRGRLRGLNGPKFVRAIKELGVEATRTDLDLIFIESMRGVAVEKQGQAPAMDLFGFYRAVCNLAQRRFPDHPAPAAAVNALLATDGSAAPSRVGTSTARERPSPAIATAATGPVPKTPGPVPKTPGPVPKTPSKTLAHPRHSKVVKSVPPLSSKASERAALAPE